MLRELVEYYDCIIQQPDSDFVPDGFMKVPNVAYKIVLTQDGRLKDILPNTHIDTSGKKPKEVGYDEIFPFSNSYPGIKAKEVIDYREKYLFGFDEWDEINKCFIWTKGKHGSITAFQENKNNISFFEDLSSPVMIAYKKFINNWIPENEICNPILSKLGKNYKGAKFIIVLEGEEPREDALHQNIEFQEKWLLMWNKNKTDISKDDIYGQCSISGKFSVISRIHNKLTGITGGKSEVNLVCFNEDSGCSYGKKQSYNSSISTEMMERYTKIFNYLTSSKHHKRMLDDMTLLFWANTKEKEAPYLDEFIYDLWDTEDKLEAAANEWVKGKNSGTILDNNIEFCIVGIKPNSSRLAIKFFEKNKFGNIIDRIEAHQRDLSISEKDRPLSLGSMFYSLKSPKSDNDSVPPDLSAKIMTAILRGTPYPEYLLQTVVRRAKIDRDDAKQKFYAINSTRVRMIKACLIRSNYYKGDEYMLDSAKQTVAFRCGRLFAVLEKIQKEALGDINATIKDKFFASACSTPDLVFTRLLKLAQPHLAKLEDGKNIYYDKLLQEILTEIEAFPKALSLQKQGDFILGYYQQKQKLYEKRIDGGAES